jgi:eukaryotic-like serine/threonine-protein kinase
MPLSAGDRLGPYEILALIGNGGMGEVFKARDTRLDRIVAIKVSNSEFSERFEREARAIATLNHPHICQLYDVGPNYLVMEYIEGAPLKGPMPLALALRYGAQICDALGAAHEKNIVHRDLKPANIMVTKSAGVKLLDFGLAKIGPPVRIDQTTKTMGLTGKGEILGTLSYMSPEQVNGQDAGPQSDIFSFGLVLYEMLTGKRAFEGSTPASAIAAILTRPAPSISDVAPAALDRALKRCLEKDPENRWQSARDLKAELEWITRTPEPGKTAPASPMRASRLSVVAWSVAAIALALAAWGWGRALLYGRPALLPLVSLDLDLRADPALPQGGGWAILSPDGSRLVYASMGRLWTRRLDQPEATELPGTEAIYPPFFSPDGQWIAFAAQGKLKKISIEGGAPIVLCDAPFLQGGSWGTDGNIIANLGVGGLSRLPSSGGMPTPVTELEIGESAHFFPQILPGGAAVLFTSGDVVGQVDKFRIEVVTLADRHRRILVQGGTYGRYLAASNGAGYLTYVSQGTLYAVPFDLKALEVRGTPVPMLERIDYSTQLGYAWYSVSQTGALLYRSGEMGPGGNVVAWVDAAGQTQPLLAKTGVYQSPRLSPDGQRLAVVVEQDGAEDIWIYDLQRDTLSRLTSGGALSPVWTPDGRYIVFGSLASGMFWTRADGSRKPQPLNQSKNIQFPNAFTPDGKRLVFVQVDPKNGPGLWTLPIENDGTGLRSGKPQVFLATPFLEGQASFSPDGRWLAYYSGQSGAREVYVRSFPDNGGEWQISNGGGSSPIWSRSGHALFYRTSDNQIMVANYTAQGDSFVSGKPRVWSRIANVGRSGNFDLAPDGKRIAVIMPGDAGGGQPAGSHATLALNFFDELRRRVSAGK